MRGDLPRAFGGVNIIFVGDFYQLDPVGSVAFMGNPCSSSVSDNSRSSNMMGRFWFCVDDDDPDALQLWSEPQCPSAEGCKVLELDVNHRSGSDAWYSDLLASCREGALALEDWQYLHGSPTKTCGSWLSRQNRSSCGNPRCLEFEERMKDVIASTSAGKMQNVSGAERTAEWHRQVTADGQDLECELCSRERQRRHRVLVNDSADAHLTADLCSVRYKDSLYITRCNEPAGAYAISRARMFAQLSNSQILWVQAEDFMEHEAFSELTLKQKQEKKRGWLKPHFHAKRTGGIPSLLPLVYDLPLRLMSANYGSKWKALKSHGVFNQARGRLKGWELHDVDAARVQSHSELEIVLFHLPKRLFVEMEGNAKGTWENLPAKWVPLPAATTTWSLDNADVISVQRKGFACVPDFSSTVHSATGRTLSSCVCDLGSFADKPGTSSAMEGYIALSRVEDAEGLVVARPFSRFLFQQVPAPFPTLLLKVLKGELHKADLQDRLDEIGATDPTEMRRLKKSLQVTDMVFECCVCNGSKKAEDFITASGSAKEKLEKIEIIALHGSCSTCNTCSPIREEELLCFSVRR